MPKYVIRSPRFYEGQYVDASPESPKVLDIHPKYKPESDDYGNWAPYKGGPVEAEELQPHFAAPQMGPPLANPDIVVTTPEVKAKR